MKLKVAKGVKTKSVKKIYKLARQKKYQRRAGMY